jgi:HrpA-like RNA helicase
MNWEPSSSSADATCRWHGHGQQLVQQHRARQSWAYEWDRQGRDTGSKRGPGRLAARNQQGHCVKSRHNSAGMQWCSWQAKLVVGRPPPYRGISPRPSASPWHVVEIVNEAHGQSMETQLLFRCLLHALKSLCSLKLAVMSAAMDVTELQRYFRVCTGILSKCSNRVGRRQPCRGSDPNGGHYRHVLNRLAVQDTLKASPGQNEDPGSSGLDRRDVHCMIGELVPCTARAGHSILVFLLGLVEIMDVAGYLRKNVKGIAVHVLHSVVAEEDQYLACPEVPCEERHVILATSAAESSVTTANRSCVIDTSIICDTQTEDLFGLSPLSDGRSAQTIVHQCMGRVGHTQAGRNIQLFSKQMQTKRRPSCLHPDFGMCSRHTLLARDPGDRA